VTTTVASHGTPTTLPPSTGGTPPPTTVTPDSSWASFAVAASPNEGSHHDQLHAVTSVAGAAAGASTLWAVGDYYNGATDRTLVERDGGSGWALLPSPNASTSHNELDAVAGTSSGDAWAVGRYAPGIGQDRSRIEHWNGRAWSLVPSPQAGLYHNELDGVAAESSTDAWAVGHYDTFRTVSDEAMIDHWNGRGWAVQPSPHPAGTHSGLVSISTVRGSASVWAVGYLIVNRVTRTLTERWEGGRWAIVPSPNVGIYHNELDGVVALSADDAWAVGWYFSGTTERTLIEHWDGRSWTVTPSPNANNGHNALSAVAADNANEVFAVGDYFGGVNDETLVVQWNGQRWQVVPSANSAEHLHNELDGVAAEPGGAVAVGTYFDGKSDRTLIERALGA
jgi:hypothetical protein